MLAMVLMTIALATLAIALFITRHIVANAITRVVTITIAFVGMQRKGWWQGRQEQWQW
jgi:hypothetical protein